MKNILFVIEGSDKKKIKKIETKIKERILSVDSLILGVGRPQYDIVVIASSIQQLYYNMEVFESSVLESPGIPDQNKYVCLLNEDMVISDNFLNFYSEYSIDQEKIIYLPLVVIESKKAKGVLNNCMWNSNLATEVGYLDNQLALRQIDTTLYGALIPYECFVDETYYNNELSYYQHFYFLNKFADNEENLVVGIPKILFTTTIDLSFEGVEDDVKVRNFKMAREISNKTELKVV